MEYLSEQIAETVPQFECEEQPGGRVALVDGRPWRAASLEAENAAAYGSLEKFYPWLGPLMEAAILSSFQDGDRRAAFSTPWGGKGRGEPADIDKHDAYVRHVCGELDKHLPWLVAVFHAAQADVLIAPEGLSFTLSNRPGAQWDVPGLTAVTGLVPFREDGEQPQH